MRGLLLLRAFRRSGAAYGRVRESRGHASRTPPWTGGSEARGGHRVGERWRWTPLVLEERHSSELGQPVWAAGERGENGFLVGARQPDDRPSMPPGRLERFRGAVESERTQTSNEIAHEPVGDRKTCEQHSVERTRGDYRPRPPGCKPVERSELAAQSCRVRPCWPATSTRRDARGRAEARRPDSDTGRSSTS